MPTPLLPSLKEDKITISKRGEWISENQNTLRDLVDDLKVTVNNKSDVSSIPDIWARPAMYEAVLSDKNNHFYDDYVAEWRGIITILALREARGIKDVKLYKFEVPNGSDLKGDEPKFLQVLSKLLPEKFKTIYQENCLMQVLSLKNRPIAFVWPGLLLCPAVELHELVVDNISWWKNNQIDDPVNYLSDTEKALMVNWISRVIDSIPDNEQILFSLLESFKSDLNVENVDARYNFGVKLGIEGLYECIDYPLVPVLTESCITASHVRLVNQKGSNSKTLLVITNDMNKQWGEQANKIVVAGNATFDSVSNLCFGGRVLPANKKVINGIDIDSFGAELCGSEDFFTDKIGVCYVERDMFPNSLLSVPIKFNGANARVILPLKQRILEYLTAEWIAEHIKINVISDLREQSANDIEVEIKLPLSGNGDERLLTLQKIYHSSANEIINYDELPLIQLWPNFITDNPDSWKAYYSFFDAPVGWQRNTFYAEPYWENLKVRSINNSITNKYAEIIKGETFPEAYTCYSVAEKASGNKKEEIGLVLLRKPEKIQNTSGNKNCKIGVDFGTTNSVAYFAINDENPEMMRFKNRLYSIVEHTDNNRVELRRNFLSLFEQPNSESSSIRSIFHTYIGDYDGELDKPLVRGNIYYLEDSKSISEDSTLLDTLHADMKWNEEGTEYMTGFLMQFCLQCMAEAVVRGSTNIEWKYSYPTAFTKKQIDDMKRLWSTYIVPGLAEISNLTTRGVSDSKTESVSMAEFFKNREDAAIQRGIICFDIGGGSTDIAIWQGSEKSGMRYQCSLKFAGRKILNEYLYNKKLNKSEILKSLASNTVEYNEQLNRVISASSIKSFHMEIEALLKYHEDLIFNSLATKNKNDGIAIVLRDIAFALAGIFYYSGNIITYLRNNDNYDEKEKLPNCYVGGNASKLLNWGNKGEYLNNMASLEELLVDALISGIYEAKPNIPLNFEDISNNIPKVYKTDLPKQEVAYGLVCDTNITIDAKADSILKEDSKRFGRLMGNNSSSVEENNMIAGETFLINGNRMLVPIITKEHFCEGTVKIDSTLPLFRAFVETFNDSAKRLGYDKVIFEEKDFGLIVDKVNQDLADKSREAKKSPDNVVIEPLFVMVLSRALDLLANK